MFLRFSIFIATELIFTLFVLIDSVGLRDCQWLTIELCTVRSTFVYTHPVIFVVVTNVLWTSQAAFLFYCFTECQNETCIETLLRHLSLFHEPAYKNHTPLAIIKLSTLNVVHLVNFDHKLFVVLLHILFYLLFTAQLGFLQCCVDTLFLRGEKQNF